MHNDFEIFAPTGGYHRPSISERTNLKASASCVADASLGATHSTVTGGAGTGDADEDADEEDEEEDDGGDRTNSMI